VPIPVIDLFPVLEDWVKIFLAAKPNGERASKIKLSIEMEEHAHRTLELRRSSELSARARTEGILRLLRGKLSRGESLQKFPDEAACRIEERAGNAWQHALPKRKIDERIPLHWRARRTGFIAVRPARPLAGRGAHESSEARTDAEV